MQPIDASGVASVLSSGILPAASRPPSMDDVARLVDALRRAIFPGYFNGGEITGDAVRELASMLEGNIARAIDFGNAAGISAGQQLDAGAIAAKFIAMLPDIRQQLEEDMMAHYIGDPAAVHPAETVLCYPGMTAITCHRLAHALLELGVPVLPRMMSEHAHSATGIDIHPGAKIGRGFFMDHGTGIVIGETSIIGDNVRIYQGVTLGAKSFPLDPDGNPIKGIERHPVVEDDVIIYSGATILGRVRIGRGSVIGGNVWVTRDVPPGTILTQTRAVAERFENGGGV